jgi:predicted RNA methylase
MISLPDLCREISVSEATGKNWLRLGKIAPTKIYDGNPLFSETYVENIKNNIKKGTSVLKSRRNKKHISGTGVYNAYVRQNSPNVSIVEDILKSPKLRDTANNEDVICCVIAECALKLIGCKSGVPKKTGSYLEYFCNNKKIWGDYAEFVEDIIKDCKELCFFENLNFKFVKNEDTLGLLYISLKNIGSRKAKGAYYTPTEVVEKLISSLFGGRHTSGKKVLDPCCGTGNFLLSLPERIKPQNIYACDIDEMSVKLARINMLLKHGTEYADIIRNNIRVCDYLNHDFTEKFDFIIGNPPWGYDYTAAEKKQLRERYKSAKRCIESYDIFTEQAVYDLEKDGITSFVLPSAILNVKAHKPIRKIILGLTSLKYIEYLGEAFDNVQCPSVIMQIKKDGRAFNTKGMTVKDGKKNYKINTKREVSADYFGFRVTDDEYNVLKKINSVKNKVTLKNNADFALGIVTGDNKKYLSSIKTEDNEAVLRGCDICKFYYKAPKNHIRFTPEKFQQCADEKYYRADEKLFYRFISSKLVFAYDNKKTLSLNSTNILIPRIESLDIKYITAVLNSSVAQFYFEKNFGSIKVLKSHIERIPIPFVDEDVQEKIIAGVDEIISEKDKDGRLYEKLDSEVARLYGITDSEFDIIKNALL